MTLMDTGDRDRLPPADLNEDEFILPEEEESKNEEGAMANASGDDGRGVGPVDGPPAFLGPMNLEALDSLEDRHFDLAQEEQDFRDRAFLIEQAVRSAMYELAADQQGK